jgi:hypothetical protein
MEKVHASRRLRRRHMTADELKVTETAHASRRTEGYGDGTCQQTNWRLRRRHMPADGRKVMETAHASRRTEGYDTSTHSPSVHSVHRIHVPNSPAPSLRYSGLKSTPGERLPWQIMCGFLHTKSGMPIPYLLHILQFKAVNQRFTKVFGPPPLPFHKLIPVFLTLQKHSFWTMGAQPIKQDTTRNNYYTLSKLLMRWMGFIKWNQFPNVWSKLI